MPQPVDETEALARRRYAWLNAVRIGGIAVTIAGLASARDVLPLPYAVGVAMVLLGIGAFFFGPPLLLKRWKAQDRQP
ncbi:MAG: hypothetical protein QNI87_14975 [Erythrobacter sp.]|uniref:hypothetical protein n=1 Tax=Erythrobacter sp. TaxID=1042 RepID=UPI0026217F11|nr:hypothetical protein [Erythrobacter sp.]MDJ0979826.1 hypothetical protein [Erythrobacter sp.]